MPIHHFLKTPHMCVQQAHIRATGGALSLLQKVNWHLRDQSLWESGVS